MVGVHRAQSPAAAVTEPTTSDALGADNAAADAALDAALEALPPSSEQALVSSTRKSLPRPDRRAEVRGSCAVMVNDGTLARPWRPRPLPPPPAAVSEPDVCVHACAPGAPGAQASGPPAVGRQRP